MKKIVLFVPMFIAGSLVFAAACDGGPVDADGSGGTDGGTGGSTPSGGSPNSTGGSPNSTGGMPATGGQSTGGLGGMGGFGGLGGFGGVGGAGDDALLAACETLCATAVAGDASACDESDCVVGCSDTYAVYYAGYGCEEEYLALKECSAALDGTDFFCDSGTVGTTECTDEQAALTACY